jgi:hypothetical protein
MSRFSNGGTLVFVALLLLTLACGGSRSASELSPASPTQGPVGLTGQRLEALTAEASDVSCSEAPDGSGALRCAFTIEWSLDYQSSAPAFLTCAVLDIGEREFTHNYSQSIGPEMGNWESSDRIDGDYASPGEYEERIMCQMRVPGIDGEVVSQLEELITLSITLP